MDGLEASAKIIELGVKTPIVAMTANVMREDREIYKQSGMNDCVGKPFTSQELWRCLLKYLMPVNSRALYIKTPEKKPQVKLSPQKVDMEFMKELQEAFYRYNRKKFDEIANALKADDIKLAYRLAHTLKSNAGQIGKTSLQEAASDVEFQLSGGKNLVTPQQMALLETELNAALSQIEVELSALRENQSDSSKKGEILDSQSTQELFGKLEPMLKMGSPESLKLIDALRRIPGSEELIRRIDDYSFDEALEALVELRKRL